MTRPPYARLTLPLFLATALMASPALGSDASPGKPPEPTTSASTKKGKSVRTGTKSKKASPRTTAAPAPVVPRQTTEPQAPPPAPEPQAQTLSDRATSVSQPSRNGPKLATAPSPRPRRTAPPSSGATAAPSLDMSLAVFGGLAIPFGTDLRVRDSDPDIQDNFTAHDLTLRNLPSLGAKFTVWTPAPRKRGGFDIGLELDYTRFNPSMEQHANPMITGSDIDGPLTQGDIEILKTRLSTHIAAVNLMMRWPIGVTEAFPHGRWYPYVGVGGGAQFTRAESKSGMSDTSLAGVRQILAGVKIFLSHRVALFGEYKNTYASHTFHFGTSQQELTIHANHVVGGVAVHF